MRFLSLFSGIEAASLAWCPLGWTPVAFAELAPFPAAVLAHRWPDVPNLGDVTRADWTGYRGAVDVMVGGPPCQAFSVAGLRDSMADDRGLLSLAYVRAIHAVDPRWAVTENVPGWLSTKDNAFGCFLAALVGADAPLVPPRQCGGWTDAGMVVGPVRTAAWRILDAQFFGLAQRRRRVFVVSGRAGDWRRPAAVLLEQACLRGDPPPRREAGEGIAPTLAPGAHPGYTGRDAENGGLVASTTGNGFWTDGAGTLRGRAQESHEHLAYQCQGSNVGEAGTLRSGHNIGSGVPFTVGPLTSPHGGSGHRVGADEASAGHILAIAFNWQSGGDQRLGFNPSADTTGALHAGQHPAVALGCFDDPRRFAGVHRGGEHGDRHPPLNATAGQQVVAFSSKDHGVDAGETAPTLRACGHDRSHANGGAPPAVTVVSGVRRLTPRETERLQGMPDDHTRIPWRGRPAEECPDGPRYKAVGNSMAVPVLRWIGERVAAVDAIASEAA